MTPEEAIKILDTVCAQVQLNRDQHVKIQECVTRLRVFIQECCREEDAIDE